MSYEMSGGPINGPTRLLSRLEVEQTYGVPARWLELAAMRGDGPPMVRISRRMIRYRAADVEAWIEARTVASTSEDL